MKARGLVGGAARTRAAGRAKPAPVGHPHLAREKTENVIELARYIAEMTAEMARLANHAKLEMLAYFLTIARVESEMIARQRTAEGYGHADE